MPNKVLPLDENRYPILVASGMKTQDASGTPKVSPLTVTDTIIEVVFPEDAVELHIVHTSQALRVSENEDDTGGTLDSYIYIPANGYVLIQKAEGGSVWMQRDGANSAVVSFCFRTIHEI
jgi:hypothetical protein